MAPGREKGGKRTPRAAGRLSASASGRRSVGRAGIPALHSLLAIWADWVLRQAVDQLVGFALVERAHGQGRDLAPHAAGESEGGGAFVVRGVEDHAEGVRSPEQRYVVEDVAETPTHKSMRWHCMDDNKDGDRI